MLDINLIRKEPEKVKKSEKKREKDPKIVDKVLKIDKEWRKLKKKNDKLRHKRNKISKEINKAKKKSEKKKAGKLIKEAKKIPDKIDKNEEKSQKLLEKRDKLRYKIGNLLHKDVPKKLEVVRKHGRKPKLKNPKSHSDLVKDLDLADTDKAGEVVGSRHYYLKNELVILNFALQRFAFDILMKKDYSPIYTPFLLGKKAMEAVSELADFEETLYKIDGEDLFLIATSEQTIISYHFNETLKKKDLPKKYVGFSTNFRKEAGSHGKDTKGIFRTHQFDKVEQIILSEPEKSWEFHEEMIKNTEEIYKKLKIPYRIVNIPANDMNDNGSKKYDIEGWFPAQKKYRELGSGTNCTDYQSRKANIRYDKKGEIIPVHTLNCTAIATERTMTCILENYQQKDGSIKIPKVLRKYTGFKKIKAKQKK
jgi:seryl-tRNA synthetase